MAAIPSFSSFPELESTQAGPSSSRSPAHRSEHKRERKSKRSHKHKYDSTKGNISQDDEICSPWSTAELDKGSPLFYSDRKGDHLNVRYGGLHSGDIPKYRLVAGGKRVLGLNDAWIVLYRSGKGIEVGMSSERRKQAALTDSGSRALLNASPTRRLLASDAKYKYEEIDGFLRLPSRRGRKDDQSYRSITFSKNSPDSDSESSVSEAQASHSSDEDLDTTPLTSRQDTLKSLEQRIASDPSSISTWLSLLHHSLLDIPVTSKNATKARSEITLAILTRALSAHPSNSTSKKLRLKYIKAGENVWHETKLRSEWEAALAVGGVDIWMDWLEWRIGVSKSIDNVVKDARRVLDALGHNEEMEVSKVRVTWRIAVVFQTAGYPERATALFQAQAELVFEVPQAFYGLPIETQLDALEEFWESEIPRCGEPGANGWSAWVSTARPEHIPLTTSVKPTTVMSPKDPFSRWAAYELEADRTMRAPARSSDENDDPYAAVMFSDIRPLLLELKSQRAKDIFRLAWLTLLGLHIPGFSSSLSPEPSESRDDRWAYMHLDSPSYLSRIFSFDQNGKRAATEAYAGVVLGREKKYASGFGPVKDWGYDVTGPLTTWHIWVKEDVQGVDEAFIRKVFSQLRMGPEDWEWDVYALAFEAAVNIKGALKLSKSFLSIARDSLPHWEAHANLERSRNRTNDARKVYQTVLTTSSSPSDQPGVFKLWWSWAEMEWLANKPDEALQAILRSVGVESTGGLAILRAKRALEDALLGISYFQWKEREACIKLRALLELLSSSLSVALSFFDTHLLTDDSLKPGASAHESLFLASLLMAYHYVTTLRNPSPPSALRDRVQGALEMYPNNTLILGIFLEGEKGYGIWGRVRAMLGESVTDDYTARKEKNLSRRVAEVWIAGWEKGRWESEIERTRNGLASAVNDQRTRGSSVIWRVYLEFEIRVGQLQRAKKLLYRAIGECPLYKELYLLAFGPLRSVFEPKELVSIADTMAERGLRMRRGLDEEEESWADNGLQMDESEESGDEIENNARDMRRLMPY